MGGKTIKGSVTLDMPKNEKKKDDDDDKGKGKKKSKEETKAVFEYVETKSSNQGGGPRGIDIWKQGERGME